VTCEPTTRTHSARKRFKRRTNFPRLRRNPLVSSGRNPFTQDGAYVAEQCDSSPSAVPLHQRSRSSAVERTVHIGDVAGSIPAATTTFRKCRCVGSCQMPGGPDARCYPRRNWLNEAKPAQERRRLEVPELTDKDKDRFWRFVRKAGPDDCWEWTGARSKGYGHFAIEKKVHKAHRVACRIAHGQPPEVDDYHGAVVMHTCDNRACCNPAHLKYGTHADNARDMFAKGRGATPTNRKLTAAQVREICTSPLSIGEVAKKVGVSSHFASLIRRFNGKVPA
jgi:hypothetical protein